MNRKEKKKPTTEKEVCFFEIPEEGREEKREEKKEEKQTKEKKHQIKKNSDSSGEQEQEITI